MISGDRSRGAMAEINVTPLVDVMLVLLIIFMVPAPLLQQGLDVNVTLPKAQANDVQAPGRTQLVITLTKEHLVYVNKELMTLKELRSTLSRAHGETPVIIRADRYAYVDKLIELWDLCRQAGLREVRIATLPE